MEESLHTWQQFVNARQLLFEQNIIRTFNNPIEDFSEFLVSAVVKGRLARNVNQKDYDVETDEMSIQVKSVAKAPNNPNGYIVTARDRENQLATHYAFCFFQNYVPSGLYIVNADFVRDFGRAQIKRHDLEVACQHTDLNFTVISVKWQQ